MALAAHGAPVPGAAPGSGYPRTFTGRNLRMIAFPLGGVAAGSISLGGRGQLRDWEIFNRADKGHSPRYAFAALRVKSGTAPAVVRVLEARIAPPYEAARGLGPGNVPGLRRFRGATFTGEYPLATVALEDAKVPVGVTLEAFSPLIPLDAEESGLPVAVLRYRVTNTGARPAAVSVVFALDNPIGREGRVNEYRESGFLLTNPKLAAADPDAGSLALRAVGTGGCKVTHLSGWPRAKWWASPLLFWDDFCEDGELGPEAPARDNVASLCLSREIAAGARQDFTFLLAWHFPNRTPARCGWTAPEGEGDALIGNHYCTRFPDAWAAADYTARNLPAAEARMRKFLTAMRQTTLPAVVKEAAMANLSTLATQTCFRTADGRFRGFEGTGDQRGCCHGTCTHVWNYETATHHLFPALARSMRETAFRVSDAMGGVMPIRVLLPEGKQKEGITAADGTMGQIVKAYFDWQLSGDDAWLRALWPSIRKALEFAWVPGGWDADRDGVMEGVQHNTYDVEFYGPNPMCGVYYLAALRAAEEMARAVGDGAAARDYRTLFEKGSAWIDAHLFNGEYYVQQVRGIPTAQIAPPLRSTVGAEDSEHPTFQLGEGCLVDQLVGQYVADFAGLGPLLDREHIRKTLQSIYRYNYKRTLYEHDSVQRIFALNDEAALVICDYASGKRPKIPFPYFAEVMTGFEYSAAMLMLYYGMVDEGIECIANIRRRYDGERRNPWDEAECGHHYARAMAAWTAIPALSGFRYRGPEATLEIAPKVNAARLVSFWSTATGWGTFTYTRGKGVLLVVEAGQLRLRQVTVAGAAAPKVFADPVTLREGQRLEISLPTPPPRPRRKA